MCLFVKNNTGPPETEGFFVKHKHHLLKAKAMKQLKVAVVGATGLVGTKMLQVLAERNFPVTELIPVASEKSVGKEVEFKGKKYKVVGMADAISQNLLLQYFQQVAALHWNGRQNLLKQELLLLIILLHGEWILPRNWLFLK